MQRYIYVHENEYTQAEDKVGVSDQQHSKNNSSQQQSVNENGSTTHDAEWWSTEARALIQYVALWSAPDISAATAVRVMYILSGSEFAVAKQLVKTRTPIVWIASFIQEHGHWTGDEFLEPRLLMDCFEPSVKDTAPLSATARNCIRRAVVQNPPREAGESRRVFPLDLLDLRVLPESLKDEHDCKINGVHNASDKAAANGVPFSYFEQIFGSLQAAQEEWELAEIVDGVGEPYRGESGFALQLYALEISGRGKFKGQKRPLIFSVILDAGCAQGSVLQALYPQMPRIARLIEGMIFRPAAQYEDLIVDDGYINRRNETVRVIVLFVHLMFSIVWQNTQ